MMEFSLSSADHDEVTRFYALGMPDLFVIFGLSSQKRPFYVGLSLLHNFLGPIESLMDSWRLIVWCWVWKERAEGIIGMTEESEKERREPTWGGAGGIYDSLKFRQLQVPLRLFRKGVCSFSEKWQDHLLTTFDHAVWLRMSRWANNMGDVVFL